MGKRHRILIIDDNQFILTVLKEFFELKYKVLTAHDGVAGLQILEKLKNGIDLVITDLIMPRLGGIELISVLKKKYPTVSIIAMTGCCDEIDGASFGIHVDRFIEKPFDLNVLNKSVSELLTNKPTSYVPCGSFEFKRDTVVSAGDTLK
jgi:DNA-binding response OmpR family regulator